MESRAFQRFGAAAAIAVAAGGILYSIFFVISLQTRNRAVVATGHTLLLVGGVLASAVLVAVYDRIRHVDPPFALWGLLLGVVGAIGSAVHGGFDLANRFHRPEAFRDVTWDIPNYVDPRGLLTFGLSGLGVLILSWLITRGATLPVRLGQLGMVAGVLLVLIYLGRLIILDPENPFLLTVAVLSGVIVNPLWFGWLGMTLRRSLQPA
jgi:hypothetical protein